MLVINDTLGVYGGSHTLMMRMCQWMKENDIKSAIICRSASNTEVVTRLKQFGTKIVCIDLTNIKAGAEAVKELIREEEIKVFSFSWNYYLDLERIKKKAHLQFEHFLYCIHPATFKKGQGFKSIKLREWSIRSYRKIYERMNRNRSIIMMDEINTNESNEYLQIDLKPEPVIIRLPMYCVERSDRARIIKQGYESNMIMSAARADFPYKGYMLGLVDDFVALKHKYPDIVLEIVSGGDNIEELEEKINDVPAQFKKDIKLTGWLEYSELLRRIETCKLFVGMGTSVLDAALVYKPAVAVKYDTYENISNHLISDMPGYFGTVKECNDKAYTLMDAILGWTYSMYEAECIKSFKQVKNCYDINKCMTDFLKCRVQNQGSILSGYECFRHAVNNKMNGFRFRNKEHFDYNKLKREKI